ncbi:MAG: NAD-dependent epimerase/dehydratase family protein [Candidatus Pacearchaeota archaeon]|jgi:nucleoside-diphosphate-sugar epimerase|nr:NAD-dependent epimerase/dehydratase family protein [Candidatus Pacearchaeota archaeon]|tara:strand:+ start:2852 stop:3862 length:1011 start_codon:yes stop_codon:yes gene_type:complete
MKVFITGITGFIGLNLLGKLLKKNNNLTCYIRNSKYKSELEKKGCKVVIGELSDYNKLVKSLKRIDVVIHLVGIGNVSENSDEAYKLYQKINVEGTKTIAEASIKAKVKKFIYLSSVAAMGSYCNGIMDENSKPNPVIPYEKSKWESELALHETSSKSKLKVFILRPTWVIGKGDRKKDIIRLVNMIKKGFVPLLSGGKFHTILVSVDSVSDAIICCLNKNTKIFGTYIISDKKSYKQRELVNMITNSLIKNNIISRKPIIIPIPEPLMLVMGDIFEYLAKIFKTQPFISRKRVYSMSQDRNYSISRAKKELGFSPKPVKLSIDDEIKWLKKQRKI